LRQIIDISVKDVIPGRKEVFASQGIPSNVDIPSKVIEIFNTATELFMQQADPVGIIYEVSIPEFDIIYEGEGLNEPETPLEKIYRKADYLALFATTIGEKISKTIANLSNNNELALGSMLDSVASEGADKVADKLEEYLSDILSLNGLIKPDTGILRYSPGYCGWHISGQKKLFEFLHPEEIGIMLLDSYIMKPIKSVSGVIVVGNRKIHIFKDNYPFCAQCETHSCRERIRSLFKDKK